MAALGASEYTELVASTLEKIEANLVDQVLTRHPTLDLFAKEAKSDTGRKLVLNIEAAEDGDTSFTDDSGSFGTDVSNDIIGAAEYDWSNPLVSRVRVIWKKLQMNQGKEQLVDLLKSHIEAAKKQHAKTLVTALHARMSKGYDVAGGPTTGQFNSFDAITGDSAYDADPAGDLSVPAFTVGGITATDAAHYWNAGRIELPKDDATFGTGNIRKAFRHVRNEHAVRTSNQSAISHVVCGRNIFEEYEDELDDKIRYVFDGKEAPDAQGQFRAFWDGDIQVRLDPDCPEDRAYFLDMDSFRFRYLNGNWMKVQPAQPLTGTLDFVTPIASVVSVGTNERRANSVLLRPTTTGGDA